MTSRKDFKKLVRAHAAKTGKSYTAALKDFEPSTDAGGVPPASGESLLREDVRALLAELRSTPFGTVVGRLPAIGASADAAIASAHAHDLATNPKFFAESGSVKKIVSEQQMRALVVTGAADWSTTQVIRSFHNDHATTFSARCRLCDGWIWCGEKEREATCSCGQPYRVVFDLHAVKRWSMPQGQRCFDCGAAFQLTRPADGRNPWHPINKWQVRCNACSAKLRKFEVDCDFETPLREGAAGTFRARGIVENGRDVSSLVDQQELFLSLDHLRRALMRLTNTPVDVRRSRPLPPFRFSLQQLVDAVGQLPPVADEEADNLRVEVFSHELINTAVGAGPVPVVSPGPFMAFQKTGQGWAGEFEFDIFDGESYPPKVGRWSVRAAAIRRTTEVPGHTFERARVLVTPLAES